MSAAPIPAFNPASDDAGILAMYEEVRQARSHAYGFDDLPYDPVRDDELAHIEAATHDKLGTIEGSTAVTLEGVRTQLQLLLTSQCSERWLDRALMDHGLLALHRDHLHLDGHGQQLFKAASALLRIEWQQALAKFETASKSFYLALLLKEVVDKEQFRGGAADTPLMAALVPLAQRFEEEFCDADQFEQLIRTLVPDHEALAVKLDIIAKEGEPRFALPWIARDVAFLAGLAAQDPSAQPDKNEGAA